MSHKPRWRAIRRARHARFRRESVLARQAVSRLPPVVSPLSLTETLIYLASFAATERPPDFHKIRHALLDGLEDGEDSEKVREILMDASKPFAPALAKLLEEVIFPARQS